MDVAIHHITRAGDFALVRSQWRITGTGNDGKPIELHHHGMEVMRRQPNGEWRFFIDHPYGADPSWAVPAERIPRAHRRCTELPWSARRWRHRLP
jgi:ketosteroid isomerase-like protein